MDAPTFVSLGEDSNTTHTMPSPKSSTADAPNDKGESFATGFNPEATATHLAPTALPIAHVQRGWERKAQSPFSRRRFKVGKVWKRSAQATALAATFHADPRDPRYHGLGSPGKAVKKQRVESGGAVVANWELRGSPTSRRIVTRSGAIESGEALEALGEETEDGEDEANILGSPLVVGDEGIFQITYDDGTSIEVDGADMDCWEDVGNAEPQESPADDRIALGTSSTEHSPIIEEVAEEPVAHVRLELNEKDEASTTDQAKQKVEEHEHQNPDQVEDEPSGKATSNSDRESQPGIADAPPQEVILPEGFVSPVKGRRPRPMSLVKQAYANRRQTLPMNFIDSQPPVPKSATESEPPEVEKDNLDVAVTADAAGMTTKDVRQEIPNLSGSKAAAAEDEWETDSSEEVDGEDEIEAGVSNSPPRPEPAGELNVQINPEPPEVIQTGIANQAPQIDTFPRSALSEIGQQPHSPLRKSSRRQTSSPARLARNIQGSEKPHLVAFTPMKSLAKASDVSGSPVTTGNLIPRPLQGNSGSPQLVNDPFTSSLSAQDSQEESIPNIERCSSAPPEGPQMSPQKPRQPRISDDTALLQAFLKRADENKSSRRMSVSKRESLENRRDSDSVRQALATADQSPQNSSSASMASMGTSAIKAVPADVLAEMDPNSPSPRKPSASYAVPGVPGYEQKLAGADTDEVAQLPEARSTRRSGRAKNKPQVLSDTVTNGPNKIAIKGSADSVVLKKTDAQRLAALTKDNTRKNKAGSVLPPMRLHRLVAEKLMANRDEPEPSIDEEAETTIKWAETIASFYEGANEPDSSMLGEDAASESNAADNAPGETVAIPASETPSKPRLRRLRPPRLTASTPAKRPATTPAESVHEVPAPTSAPAPTPTPALAQLEQPKSTRARSSRLATPAKPRASSTNNTSTADPPEDPAPEEPAPQPKKMTRKKPTASKLPAPVASSYLSTGYAPAGKETSHSAEPTYTIASPPKKRARSAASAPAPKTELAKIDLDQFILPAAGMASPAKKGRKLGARTMFGNGKSAAKAPVDEGKETDAGPPSLGSPAKKRGRRIGL